MGRTRRAHPEWVLMVDRGIPVQVIARLNDVDPAYVQNYVKKRGEALRGGPAPVLPRLHDRPRPRPAHLPDPDRRWKTRLEELDAFLVEHQRRPHTSRNETDRARGSEWALAHWLVLQRSKDRTGRLAEHRARWLDGVLPSWRVDDRTIENEARWRLRLVDLVRYRTAQGRWPARHRDADEDELALEDWLRIQRRAALAGSLPAERWTWLDREAPGWRGNIRAGQSSDI